LNNSLINFFKIFYGPKFVRIFRRPHKFKNNPKFRIEFNTYNPKNLFLHVKRNSGFHKCLISIYSYGVKNQLDKRKFHENVIIDRIFFDFDMQLPLGLKELKNELIKLRAYGVNHEKTRQNKIKEHLQKAIIHDKISERAIMDAKLFATKFYESFGAPTLLFFSGFKGCHAYTFFNPVQLSNPNKIILEFASTIKKILKLETMDLAVNKNPIVGLSRIPYSKHELTDLTVIPFNLDDSYPDIIDKSLKPSIEPFTLKKFITDLNQHLKKNDTIMEYNKEIKLENSLMNPNPPINNSSKIQDHRKFFKELLGPPSREYEYYNMYNCPFPDHEDKNPSFKVSKKGYSCYGCQKHGNYWQFLKDYHGWTDEEVRTNLQKNRT